MRIMRIMRITPFVPKSHVGCDVCSNLEIFNTRLTMIKKIMNTINLKGMSVWTRESENMLLRWGEQSQCYKIMYEQSAQDSQRKDRWFGVPLVILGCMVTSGIFMQLDQCDIYLRFITGGLALVFTIMTAIGKTLGYSENEFRYTEIAKSYEHVVMDIQEQLSRPHNVRSNCSDFVALMKATMRDLKRAPSVPSSVYKRYISNLDEHMKHLGIPICENEVVRFAPISSIKSAIKSSVQTTNISPVGNSTLSSPPLSPLATVSVLPLLSPVTRGASRKSASRSVQFHTQPMQSMQSTRFAQSTESTEIALVRPGEFVQSRESKQPMQSNQSRVVQSPEQSPNSQDSQDSQDSKDSKDSQEVRDPSWDSGIQMHAVQPTVIIETSDEFGEKMHLSMKTRSALYLQMC